MRKEKLPITTGIFEEIPTPSSPTTGASEHVPNIWYRPICILGFTTRQNKAGLDTITTVPNKGRADNII